MNRIARAGLLSAACALGLAAFATQASAQFFGQFGPLNRLPYGQKSLGAYLGGGGGDLGPIAEFRFNYGGRSTAGIQASLVHSTFGAQADLRAGLLGTGGDFPLELGGQAAGGLITGGGATSLFAQVVPGLSAEWDAGGGQTFSAWAGLGLRVLTSTKHLGASDGVLRIGARFAYSPELGMAANLEDVGGDSRIEVGADFRFGGAGSNAPAH